MATMNKGLRNGHVGEANVFLKLCEWGCSANYLTQSDFGLDIHVQIPLLSVRDPLFLVDGDKPTKDGWELDNKFAHLQVKFREDGIWYPDEKDQEHIAGWVSASESGIPTFVALVQEDRTTAYADASTMKAYQNGEIHSFSVPEMLPFIGNEFLLNAYLWGTYPILMSELGLPPKLENGAFEYLESQLQSLARGECIKQRIRSSNYDEVIRQLEQILDCFVDPSIEENFPLRDTFIKEAIPPWAIYADEDRQCDDNESGWSCNNATILPMPSDTVINGLELVSTLCELRYT